MKILSTLSFLLLGFLSCTAFAKQCTTSWELKSSGFTLGIAKEVLNLKDNGELDLTSDFNPNVALKIFGVDKVKRTIILDSQKSMVSRQELVGTGKNAKKVLWKPLNSDSKTYHRIIKGEIVDTFTFEDGKKIIDSTIFPYLFYLNMLNSPQVNVKVLSSSSAYDAVIELTATNKTKFAFTGGKSKGYVIVNEDKYPQYFSFTQEGKTVEGIQTDWQCN